MNIISKRTSNKNIHIMVILSELTGRGAMEIEEHLFASLDEGKCYQIINLKHVQKIDGLGINILHKFVSRGMLIRLFNVSTEIRGMLRLSGKENVIKTYKEIDCNKVVSIFEKEISEKKDTVKNTSRGRRHPRINTLFLTEFKYHPDHNGVAVCKANVLNLSEGGILADIIMVIGKKTGEKVNKPEIVGKELYDLRFNLTRPCEDGSSEFFETKGVCVWEEKKNGRLCVGIRFKDTRKENEDKVRDYVYKMSQFKD
jgi:anti-anti-sigma regulatory factor